MHTHERKILAIYVYFSNMLLPHLGCFNKKLKGTCCNTNSWTCGAMCQHFLEHNISSYFKVHWLIVKPCWILLTWCVILWSFVQCSCSLITFTFPALTSASQGWHVKGIVWDLLMSVCWILHFFDCVRIISLKKGKVAETSLHLRTKESTLRPQYSGSRSTVSLHLPCWKTLHSPGL